MARISFSALVEEITGKLAGSVFQDSYGGFQIRTRVTPRNPQTQYQQLRRGEFGYLSASWRNLTSVQRQTFIDAASTPPAALNLFLRANINLTLIEEPTIDTYVASSDPGTMAVEFFDASPESILIHATGAVTTVPAGTKLLLQVTFQKAPTKIFTNPSQYSPIISFDEGTDLSVPTDILTEWTARYGVLLPDKRLCLKSALIDKSNGLRGADTINCTITEAMAAKYIPLLRSLSPQTVSGTGIQNLGTMTVPANTLITDGDQLLINYQVTGAGGAITYDIGIDIDGAQAVNNGLSGDTPAMVRAILTRIDSTHWSASIEVNLPGFSAIVLQFNNVTVDFTASFDISVRLSSSTAASITKQWGSVDLVKAP